MNKIAAWRFLCAYLWICLMILWIVAYYPVSQASQLSNSEMLFAPQVFNEAIYCWFLQCLWMKRSHLRPNLYNKSHRLWSPTTPSYYWLLLLSGDLEQILVLHIVLVRPKEPAPPKRNPSPSRPLQRRLSRSSIWMPAYSILRHLDDIQRRRQRRWIRGTNCSEDSLVLDHHQLGMSMNSEESSTKFAMKGQNWLLP